VRVFGGGACCRGLGLVEAACTSGGWRRAHPRKKSVLNGTSVSVRHATLCVGAGGVVSHNSRQY
jgi:hypothetical protein